MLSFSDMISGFRRLGLDRQKPVIAHASLSAFGEVHGGAEALLGALIRSTGGVMMPSFTSKTMLIPEDGPLDNGLEYGSGKDINRLAEFFRPDMPADRHMGIVSETLRRHPNAHRSNHPCLSFTGINVDAALQAQTLYEALAPVRILEEMRGYVLLLGVDHTSNTSIHYAEKLCGRKQFLRWALTPAGVASCPGYPGCSDGFIKADPYLAPITRQIMLGKAVIRLLPLQAMVEILANLLRKDPLALLCDRDECERCNAVRFSIEQAEIPPEM
jgi:aminoglycoside 3-N-acetyltransferase